MVVIEQSTYLLFIPRLDELQTLGDNEASCIGSPVQSVEVPTRRYCVKDRHWHVQDAKQRFSELIRRAQTDGAQVVTEHGADVAVVLGIEEFHRLSGAGADFKGYLRGGPTAELAIARSDALPREVNLSDA